MRSTLRNAVSAVLLGSVAAMPLATAFTIATAEVAVAKGKEKKESKSRGDRGRGKDKAAKVRKAKKAKSVRSAKRVKPKAMTAPAMTECDAAAEDCTTDLAALPANVLGKANGALHASENAIKAHIMNGQYERGSGPVSLMANYAYQKTASAESRELLESGTAQEYADYIDVLGANGFGSQAEYDEWYAVNSALDPADRPADFDAVVGAVEAAEGELGTSAFEMAAEEKGMTWEEYQAAAYGEGADGSLVDPEFEALYDSQGMYDPDTAQDIVDAEASVQSYEDAFEALYGTCKDCGAEGEDAEAFRSMIDARVDSYSGIDALYEEMNPEAPEEEVVGEGGDAPCDIEDASCVPEGETLAGAE